ncbi:hypothetical protein VTK26DRAFT_6276 [Humicola hyalothermophila]
MHHHRRKSGHASTDARRAVTVSDPFYKKSSSRPAQLTRRTTPQSIPKLGKNPRDREREWEEDSWWEEERESFPQYCMICEKQFVPSDDQILYCSEECRLHDQNSTAIRTTPSRYASHQATQYPVYPGPPEHRDIIPRASPSRPNSTQVSPPATPTSAISALKSLSIQPASPTSPVGTYHSNLWPLSGRSVTAASPHNSYSRPSATFFSSTYDGVYYSAGGSDAYGSSSDRPLPSRRPGSYSRPKSIELVTPLLGR